MSTSAAICSLTSCPRYYSISAGLSLSRKSWRRVCPSARLRSCRPNSATARSRDCTTSSSLSTRLAARISISSQTILTSTTICAYLFSRALTAAERQSSRRLGVSRCFSRSLAFTCLPRVPRSAPATISSRISRPTKTTPSTSDVLARRASVLRRFLSRQPSAA